MYMYITYMCTLYTLLGGYALQEKKEEKIFYIRVAVADATVYEIFLEIEFLPLAGSCVCVCVYVYGPPLYCPRAQENVGI